MKQTIELLCLVQQSCLGTDILPDLGTKGETIQLQKLKTLP